MRALVDRFHYYCWFSNFMSPSHSRCHRDVIDDTKVRRSSIASFPGRRGGVPSPPKFKRLYGSHSDRYRNGSDCGSTTSSSRVDARRPDGAISPTHRSQNRQGAAVGGAKPRTSGPSRTIEPVCWLNPHDVVAGWRRRSYRSLTASGGNATAADGPSPEKAHTRACRHIGVITGPPRGIASSPMASKPTRS